ncbi:TIGR03085 family metal-binding protein [Nakamurella sp. PAMC28650]|uniref:TIGR03085 family metal-binding protein n=1 Tax=Nakamurella sp. PAMC28650 TaxID=2762325 RepID=UPI00164E4ACA|nr:TIGR03085 family metal-binding protein [Nakamurella sp. PAMC28650]QNK80049.1 TIGR03085 family protein [Nakamurella sp. PAMC28650]
MTLAQTERAELADLFGELGPDQPTLCQGWDTSDLLAHLLIRERRMDAALGVVIKPLAGWTARVSAEYKKLPWVEQIELLRSGPPWFSPLGWGPIDAKANGMEMFIHHEDARRGQPDWQPRTLTPAARQELIPLLTSSLVVGGLKKKGIPVTARLTDDPDDAGGPDRPIVLVPSADLNVMAEQPGVVIRGGVGEILLWLSGRSEVRIEFEGDPDAIASVKAGEQSL